MAADSIPRPARYALAVDSAPPAVQLDPLYSTEVDNLFVKVGGPLAPPAHKKAVVVPAAAPLTLLPGAAGLLDHDVPL